MSAYARLIERSRARALLESCSTLLEWDEDTYMPSGGIEHRSRQRALMAGIHHEALSDPAIGALIAEIEGSSAEAETKEARINVAEIARLHRRHRRLPRNLVEEIARVTTIAEHAFASAKRAHDWSIAGPHLARVVALQREKAHALGDSSGEAYDALLEEFEPGARASDLADLFYGLAKDVRPLLDAIQGSGRTQDVTDEVLHRTYPIDQQRRLIDHVVEAIGFDFGRGRLDLSRHGFCVHIGPGDVRLAIRFSESDLSEGLYSALHEAGHGLYDQGLDPAHWGTPAGEPPSLGLHEAQSRLWENFVGRSFGFLSWLFPKAESTFRPILDDVGLDRFHAAANRVLLSANRARADMITYDLHILVRFELERALISGALEVDDLPQAWDEAYKRHLGIGPQPGGEGCLQDGHWASSMFGYFPTYTLGNLIAAQLYAAASAAEGDIDRSFAKGDMQPLLGWLRTHVYRASDRPAAALVEAATGAPLSHRPFVAELKRRLSPIYGL